MKLSDVLKKDLKVIGFLLINGGVVLLSQSYLEKEPALAVLFGAVANYIVFRVQQELNNEGYKSALE